MYDKLPDSLNALVELNIVKAENLVDPWGTPIEFLKDDTNKTSSFVSLGSDKQPGGIGDAADLTLK